MFKIKWADRIANEKITDRVECYVPVVRTTSTGEWCYPDDGELVEINKRPDSRQNYISLLKKP